MKNTFWIYILFASISSRAQVQEPSFQAIRYDTSLVNGYFFIVSDQHLMILDKCGSAVYYKYIPNGNNTDFKIQPNGKMTYFYDEKFWLMDSTFNTVDSIACKNYKTDFHEIVILPNGHFLLLGYEDVKMNLKKYRLQGYLVTDTEQVTSGVIQELDARRNVVFEWHASEHFSFDDVDSFRYFVAGDEWWIHWNSMDVDKNGNILVSSRNFNEVTKISRKDGSIMWRFGGKHNQFTYINSPIPFHGQRNIRILSNEDITFLDGGNTAKPHGARGMEFKLDEKKKTAKLIWSYTYDSLLTTVAWGNVQRLNRSNTLINFGGLRDTFALCFVIADSLGNKLFQLNGPRAFRAYYYDALPFKLHRPHINCFDSAGVTYLDAGAGYKQYKWSTGDSIQIIPFSSAHDYYVFVPYGDGGYISSEKLTVKDIMHPCDTKASPDTKEIIKDQPFDQGKNK